MRRPVRFVVLAALAAEALVTVLIAEQIGALWTFLWLVGAFVLGVIVMRIAGAQAFGALLRGPNAQSGAVAGDTVLLFVAGLLLAIPGFLTDFLGLLLILPPVRHVVRRRLARSASNRFPNMRAAFTTVRLADGSIVIPGEVVEDEPPSEGRDGPPRAEGAPPQLPPT